MRLIILLQVTLSVCLGQPVITTVAGNDFVFPNTPLPALNAPLSANGLEICACAVDAAGNVLVADQGNNRVFRVSPSGILSVVAGNGFFGFSGDGGAAIAAALAEPLGVTVDSAGNIYVADTSNLVIRKISPDGTITIIAGNGGYGYSGDGGPAVAAEFRFPAEVVVDSVGNVYVADWSDSIVRKISVDGNINTIAGNAYQPPGYSGDGGSAVAAELDFSHGGAGLAVDGAGNLYIADSNNNRVRKVSPDGKIVTVAGNGQADYSGDGGPAIAAALNFPTSVAFDSAGNLYIADANNGVIRKVSLEGQITTVAGNGEFGDSGDGGPAIAAAIEPVTVTIDAAGNVYIGESSGRLRKVALDGQITTIAGNGQFEFSGDGGPATRANLSLPTAVAASSDGSIYIADAGNNRIRKVSTAGVITTIAGSGLPGDSGDGGPATAAQMSPFAVALDSAGNVYFTDPFANSIRQVSPAGLITLVAGNGQSGFSGDGGPAQAASFNFPTGVAVDGGGNVYIADSGNHRIRQVSPAGMISTIAGTGEVGYSGDQGPASAAAFGYPTGLAIDQTGNLYVADSYINVIRRISPNGLVTTVAGTGSPGYSGDGGPAVGAAITQPTGVAIDAAGTLYIGDSGNYRIRAVSPAGVITTVAGVGNGPQTGYGFFGDGGPAKSAELDACCFFGIFFGGVAVDGKGNVYLADTNNNRIRAVLVTPPAVSASPSNFQFSGASAGGQTPAQILTVTASIPFVPFNVAVSTTDGDDWLSVDANAGVATRTIQVIADPEKLSPGTYTGTITIQSAVASPASVSIPVSFQVGPGQGPLLAVDRPDLTFTFPAGAAARSQSVRVVNTGGGAFYFAAEVLPGASWLSVDPPSGRATLSAAAIFAVTANPAGLAAGVYSGRIALSSLTVGSLIVSVTMIVSTNRSAILLSQDGVSFRAVAGGGVLPSRNIGVLTLGGGALQFSAETSTVTGGNWLTTAASADQSGAPSIDVFANQGGLAAGTYYGLVKVRSPGAANTPQVTTAVLQVLPAGSDLGAELAPNALTFNATAGAESPGSQTVALYGLSAKPKAYVASSADSFLQFSPAAALVTPDRPSLLVVQPFTNSLAPGTYHSSITLQFDDSRVRIIGVTIVVTGETARAANARARPRQDTSAVCQPTQLIPAVTSLGSGFSVPGGWPVPIQAQVQDDCGTPLAAGSVIAEFNNGDPAVALLPLASGRWDGTWLTRGPAAGVTMTIRATSANRQLTGSQQVLGGFDSNQQPPAIADGGITDAASNISFGPLTPGGLINIGGSFLSDVTATATAVPYGERLGDTSVVMGDNLMPIATVDASKVTAIIPYGIPVNAQQQVLVLRANAYSLPVQVNLAAVSPAIFTTNGSQGMILDGKGNVIGPGNAAKAGDSITIWCTGLGELQPMVTAGDSGPATSTLMTPVSLSIGGQAAAIQFSGLAPQLVGIYFVQATVPSGVATGDQVPVALSAVAGSTVVSPSVTMAIAN